MRYGELTTRKSSLFLNYSVYGEDDTDIDMDYYFWVLRSPERTVVVDCGFSAEAARRRGRTMVHDPMDALTALGVERVDLVVVTHAHYDHIGNLHRFEDVPVVMARVEYDFWTSDLARREQFWHSAEESEIAHLVERFERGSLTLVADGAEVAPGVVVEVVGGHTPGELVVHVTGGEHEVVLASDAVHFYEEVERDRPFAVTADLPEMYRAFERLRALEESTLLVAGHDPQVRSRFPRRSSDLAEPWHEAVVVVAGAEATS